MKKFPALALAMLASCIMAKAQISITATGNSTETFNSIGSTATAALPSNWKMSSAGTGSTAGYATGTNVLVTTQAATSGTPTTGARYNWATTAGTDRAIGFMTDGGYASPNSIMAYYRNTSGSTITSLTITYQVERYRVNTDAASLAFFSSTDGTAWTARTSGDIAAGVFATGASSYTFASPLTVAKTVIISGISIANNADFYLRWVVTTGTNSQGLALDDVTVTATPIITASLGDMLNDANANGKANVGETITYRDTIKNSGVDSAYNVSLTNPAPTGTTYTASTASSSALARDDNYGNGTTSGNVLTNDFGLKNGVSNLSVVSFSKTNGSSVTTAGDAGVTDNGGSITVSANGTFTYTAPGAFVGYDKFKYIATTSVAGLPNNDATVSIAVGTPASVITDDYLNAIGNVTVTDNVLTNDAGTLITVTAVNGSGAGVGNPVATTHGTVTVNANGSFTYNPTAGYTGTDAFTYTADNGFNLPKTGTVNITLTGRIWFVNSAAVSNGTGIQASPFKQSTDITGTSASDNIFLYESATAYTGSITLLSGQKLIGQDASSTLASITGYTVPSYSSLPVMNSGNGTFVTLTATNANIITLNSGNTVRGLTVNNAGTGKKITGTSFGTLTLGNSSTPDVILNGTGMALDLTTGTLAGGLTSLATTSSATQGISINAVAGTYNFGNTTISGTSTQGILITGSSAIVPTFGTTTVSSGTDGVSIQNNSGNVTFTSLGVTTTNGIGLLSTNNTGQVIVTNAVAAINATGGAALSLSQASGTTTVNLNFTGLTSSGAANAVTLTNIAGTIVGGTGSLVGTGTVFNVSGGTVGVTYSGGITQANNAATVSIAGGHATGTITFSTGTISATNGTGLQFDNADGTYNFNGTNTMNGGASSIAIFNGSSGTFSFSSSSSITNPNGGPAVNIIGGTATVTYSGSITISSQNQPLVSISGGHTTGTVLFQTGTLSATIGTGLQFDNADGTYNFNGTNTLNGGNAGVDILNGSAGIFSFSNNTSITSPSGTAFNVTGSPTVSSTYAGTITQNTASQYAVSIDATSSNTISFTGTVTAASTLATANGVLLNNCNGGNVSFTTLNLGTSGTRISGQPAISIQKGTGSGSGTFTLGTVSIFTSAQKGLLATNIDGTINSTGGTIDALSTSALDIAGPAGFTTLGMTIGTLNSTGGTNNVNLSNCSGTASLGSGALSAASGTSFLVSAGSAAITYNGTISQSNAQKVIDIASTTGGAKAFGGNITISGSSTGISITGSTNATSTNSVTISGNITATAAQTAITVSSNTAGTFTFSGTTKSISTSTANAVNLATNTGCTINFSNGGLAITTSSGVGFNATGGATAVNVTTGTNNNTISSGSGTALNVNSTTIGSSGLNFYSISVNGATNGINLNTTGSSGGGLNVTGTGTTAGSGGTIQNISARGVEFISSNNISLKNMNFTNANTTDAVASNTGLSTGNNLSENAAIYLYTVNTVSLDRIAISGTTVEEGINGNTVSNFTLSNSSIVNAGDQPDEDGIHFYNMSGTCAITNTTINCTVVTPNTTGGDDHMNLQMQSGTLNLTISGGSATNANKGSGYLFGIRGTANATITFSSATSTTNFSGGIVADAYDNATMVLNVTNSTSSGNNDQISVSAGDNSNVDVTATGNTLSSIATGDFAVFSLLGSALDNNYTLDATISGNTITVANGLAADGIIVNNAGGGLIRAAITGNTLNYAGTQRGILIQGGTDGAAEVEVTITGNTIDMQLDGTGNAVNGILAQSQVADPSGAGSSLCVNIGGAGVLKNTFTHSLGGTMAGGDIRVRQRFSGNVKVPGYGGSSTDTAAVATYLDGRNTVVSASTASLQTGTYAGGTSCQTPN